MQWYFHPDGDEFLEWHPGQINRVTAPATVQRVEPESALVFANGKVLCPLTDDGPSPGDGEVLDVRSIAFDSQTNTATAEYAYRTATSGEADAILSAAIVAKVAAVNAKGDALISAGFTHRINPAADYHTYQIDTRSITFMLGVFADHLDGASNPHGGSWRSAANVEVTMTTVQNKAFLKAAKDYTQALVKNISVLKDAARSAAALGDLDDIDIEAGTIDGAGGWPANGS